MLVGAVWPNVSSMWVEQRTLVGAVWPNVSSMWVEQRTKHQASVCRDYNSQKGLEDYMQHR